MKKLFLAATIVALSFTACDNASTATANDDSQPTSTTVESALIAYVHTDAVMAGSDLFQTEGAALQAKSEKAQASWAKSEQGFQYEVSQLQEKYQKGLITSANAQKQQESIEARVKTFQTNAQKEAKTLEEENYVFTNRAQDLFRRAIEELNTDKKYQMIIDASTIIDADPSLDLSEQVLEIINKLYAAEKK